MVRIVITQAAYEAICATLRLGSVGYENKSNERGEKLIWLDRAPVDRLRSLGGPGESVQRRNPKAGGGKRLSP